VATIALRISGTKAVSGRFLERIIEAAESLEAASGQP
jgi:hypothetical protein